MRIPILSGNGYPRWAGIAQHRAKLDEEVLELHDELENSNIQDATNEAFDVILTAVNILKRMKDINPFAFECGYSDFNNKIQKYAQNRGWEITGWLEVTARESKADI